MVSRADDGAAEALEGAEATAAWARTGSPRDPGWEGVARTPCEHGSDVLVLCRRLSDVNS